MINTIEGPAEMDQACVIIAGFEQADVPDHLEFKQDNQTKVCVVKGIVRCPSRMGICQRFKH